MAARCEGRASRCTCRVTAGPGVTVDGNGSAAAPYVVSAGGAATALAVTDSTTVNLSLTGDGSPGTPYDVTASVVLDPTPPGGGTNLVAAGPDGLFVECAGVRGCLSSGDGADYDPVTGVVTARVSTDAGNTTVFGVDGGLFTPAGGASTGVVVTDTPSVDLGLTGTGGAGDPYTVTAAVRLDASPPAGGTNLIGTGPDGLYVECDGVRGCVSAGDGTDYDPATGVMSARLSTDAGNTVVFGGDGGLFGPAPAPTGVVATDTPSVDLGLTGTGVVGDPYTVTAAVRLDAAPPGGGPNLIGTGPGGLFVECDDVRECFSAGDGAGYDPATGVITARLSTDAGNTTVFGGDGGLFTPASGGAAPTVVQAGDSPTVDTTVTGTGTALDPYLVGGSVILDPTPPGGGAQLIQSGPGGLSLECGDVRGCISAGDGAAYDPVTGVVTARVSTDAGNGTVIGGDGGLYSAVAPPTGLVVTDTPSVDLGLTGTGAGGDPYTVTAAVRLDAGPPAGGTNLIGAGPDGLYVECAGVRGCISAGDGAAYAPASGEVEARLSTDVGNRVVFGGDGGLFVPPVPAPLVGCGLVGDGTVGAPITANPVAGQEAWADTWACAAADFSTLKCDPTSGALWTPPEHASAAVSQLQSHFAGTYTQAVTNWIIIDGGVFSEGAYTGGSLTTCRGVSFQATFTGHADISWLVNSVFELGYAVSIDGGAPTVRRMNSQLTAQPAGQRLHSFTTHHAAMYPPMGGGSARVYPAIRVVAGSVTVQSWITETLLAAQTR